jgi:hypothetical protein
LNGPFQIRTNNQRWFQVDQVRGGPLSLGMAYLIQGNIGLALKSAFLIPRSAPVAQPHQPRHESGFLRYSRVSVNFRWKFHHWAIAPQALKVIEHTLFSQLCVHHDVTEVQQDPPAFSMTFASDALYA